MTKEALFTEMKAKLGTTQLSDRTIRAYVEANMPAEGVEPDDSYYETHKSILKTLEGQLNSEVSRIIKERGVTPPKETKDTKDVEPPKDNAAIEELQKQLKELKDAYDTQTKEARCKTLRSEIMNKAAEIRVTNTPLWNDVVASLAVNDQDTSETLLNTAKVEYEKKLKAYMGEGAAPFGGAPSGPNTEDFKTSLKDFADELRAMGKIPAQDK